MELEQGEVTLESPAPEITEAAGEALGRALGPGALVALVGELGSGKTTLVRGLARGLGIEGPVTSPSFALMQEYAGRVPLYHFDAWMRGREAALLAEGAAEYLDGPGVAVVEWADRVTELLPAPRLEIRLFHLAEERRGLGVRGVPGPDNRASREQGQALETARKALLATPGLISRDGKGGNADGR